MKRHLNVRFLNYLNREKGEYSTLLSKKKRDFFKGRRKDTSGKNK